MALELLCLQWHQHYCASYNIVIMILAVVWVLSDLQHCECYDVCDCVTVPATAYPYSGISFMVLAVALWHWHVIVLVKSADNK